MIPNHEKPEAFHLTCDTDTWGSAVRECPSTQLHSQVAAYECVAISELAISDQFCAFVPRPESHEPIQPDAQFDEAPYQRRSRARHGVGSHSSAVRSRQTGPTDNPPSRALP